MSTIINATPFGVKAKGRLFPNIRIGSEAKTTAEPEQVEELSPAQLKQELATEIWARLPFVQESTGTPDTTQLFARYIDSLATLEASRKDVFTLINAMMVTSIEFDLQTPMAEEARRTAIARLTNEFSIRLDSPQNLATAELAACPRPEIEQILQSGLRKAVQKFVAQFVDGLGVLVDRSVAGLVHWTGPNTVKYHFFRRRVVGDSFERRTIRGPMQLRDDSDAPGDPRRWKRVHKTTTSSQVVYTLGHHRHHAVDAFHTTIDNSKVVMPPFVQTLVAAIPDWMRPVIRVVDGYLIREEISEHEICRDQIVRTEYFDEPLRGYEPAVVLGPFVLTGWGPREIEAELERRQTPSPITWEENTEFLTGCAFGSYALSIMFRLASRQIPGLRVVSIVMLLTALFFACGALRGVLRVKTPSGRA